MYKLEFTLKQHTPIIHFQHDQDGATLRATELKPKLDRFLIERYRQEIESFIQKTASGDEYLDYKVRIDCNEKDIEKSILDTPYPCFFAAMGDDYSKNRKALSYSKAPITVLIQSFNCEIIEIIKKTLCTFFAISNFGTRQSKGFGSYYPLKLDKKLDFESAINVKFKFNTNQINTKNELKSRFQPIFEDIDLFYKILKSGFNFPNHPKVDGNLNYDQFGQHRTYYKSFLSKYMIEKGIGNEKRFIKENFFKEDVRLENDGREKRFIRAQLGLTDNYEFRGKDRKGKIEVKSEKIERFKSPIIFKVYENHVYIFFSEYQLPSTEFVFKDKFFKSVKIHSPEQELDFDDLLQAYFIYFNQCKKDFIDKNKNKNLPQSLKLIYDSMLRINPQIIDYAN